MDEIGELTLNTQTKLLRVLQEKEFERVGGTRTIRTDFRLIAATNKDLFSEVRKGNFREDLFYRLNVVPLHLPPLRERPEDIPLLLNHFLQYFQREMRVEIGSFSPAALKALKKYAWPGNVRELKNLVERLGVFTRGKQVELSDLPEEIRGQASRNYAESFSYHQAKRLFEEQFILEALRRNGGNVTATAKEIGLARKNLQIKMKELGLREGATRK